MITKLEIDGFKTFKNFQIEFSPLTVIAGAKLMSSWDGATNGGSMVAFQVNVASKDQGLNI